MLGLAYRVKLMATGDMGFTQAKKYDLEVWAPGVREWLEVSSVSNFRDFQARRMNIRWRPEPGAKPEILHTLNGSGLALPAHGGRAARDLPAARRLGRPARRCWPPGSARSARRAGATTTAQSHNAAEGSHHAGITQLRPVHDVRTAQRDKQRRTKGERSKGVLGKRR